jgi:hypothetical protein
LVGGGFGEDVGEVVGWHLWLVGDGVGDAGYGVVGDGVGDVGDGLAGDGVGDVGTSSRSGVVAAELMLALMSEPMWALLLELMLALTSKPLRYTSGPARNKVAS